MTRPRVFPRPRLYSLFCFLWLLALASLLPAQAGAMTFSPPSGTNLGSYAPGQNLSIGLSVSGGTLPMTGWYDCNAGGTNCLPTGLVIDESDNSTTTTIHGITNVAPGTYNFSVLVYDRFTMEVANYSITITGAGPSVTALSPSSGSTSGANSVIITGSGFTSVTGVKFGTTPATAFTVNSSTQITATAPGHTAGVVDVTVSTAGGTSLTSSASQYTYLAPPTAGAVSATVAANSTSNPITLNLSGGAATSVAVASNASHGTAVASGTTITYTPTAGYSGADTFTYTATNASGTSTPASVTLTVSKPTLAITPASLPSGTAGSAYNQTLASDAGTAPYTYALVSGTLPPGVTFSSAGVFSGTPSGSGTFNFSISSTDQYGATGSNSYTVTIAAPSISLAPATLPNGNYGAPYSQAVSASGGNGSYTYSVVAGSLPTGLALASGGALAGTPSAPGSYTFTLQATDGNLFSGQQAYTIVIASPTQSLIPASLPNGNAGSSYNQTFTASGGIAPYSYAITSGALPSGLSLSSTGTLSGVPTASGSTSFTVQASDANLQTISTAYTLIINAPTVSVGPTTLPEPVLGVAYSQTLSASGGTAPYSFAVTSGALPSGLSLSAAGVISGTPTNTTPANFTITATDSLTFTGARAYSVTIDTPAPVAGNVSLTVMANTISNPITLNLSGGAATSVAVASNASHGTAVASGTTITYTPTAGYSGADTFTYTATNASGTSTPASVTLTVSKPTLAITPASLPSGTAGSAYNQTLASDAGTAPYTYALVSGTLPPGVTFSSAGVFSGTPSGSGTFNFSISSTDQYGATGSNSYTVTIAAPSISLAPATLPNGNYGAPYSQAVSASGGTAPYSFAVTSGALPSGLSLSAAGVISGTPTNTTPANFTITATDSLTFTGARAYSVTIDAPAPVAGNVSLIVMANSSSNPVTLALSGGPAASVAIASNPSNGVASVTGTSITFTPNSGFAGSDSFSYTATGAGGTSSAATVLVTVQAPSITLTPANLPGATVSTAYSQIISASGGSAPYSYSLSSGALPQGLSLSNSGNLSGTPTASGNATFTVMATDNTGFTGNQAYTLTVASQAPVAGAVSATVTANSSANPITLNLSGDAASSVAVSSRPSHGTTSVSGLTISYTPTAGYSGSDSFSYTATGPGGTSAPATVTLTVSAPTLTISPATPGLGDATLGTAYSANLAASGGTAPYTYTLGSGSLPAGLTLDGSTGTISGTPTTVATSTFTITASDAHGATGIRSYNLQVLAQAIVVPPSSETLAAGQSANVNLTRGASGGPFLRARLLSVTPASAGRASMSGPFTLNFVPAAAFAGTAVVTFSLQNTGGSQANSSVTFTIQARPDPTRDPEVIGLLNAQSRAAERFASTQMDNFNRRLEQLHRPTCDRDSFNASVRHGRDDVSLGGLGKALRDELEGNGEGDDDEQRRQEKDSTRASSGECREEALAFWTDGFVNTGSNRARGVQDNSFTTYGLSAGLDYRLSPQTVVGVGFGYGNDRADIGEHDTRSEGDALGLAAYLSVNPVSEMYVDALLGYNRIRFDSRRYVTADPSNGYAHGSRDADQLFASLTASYEYRHGALSLAPYARVNGSYTRLDAFSERGGGVYGLSYEEQDLRYFTSFLGLRSGYDIHTGIGVLTPRVGLAWGHNFSRNEDYRMRYTDQGSDGLLYRLSPDTLDSNFMDLDTGLDLNLGRTWRLGLSYKTALGTNERNEMFRIGVDARF
ncbi:putative Ig domain-containing protein [Pseudomonas vlassakiae]|nr:putative Ig domain-containing protein [Pseudomonas vlassakiae]MCU0124384.1 putative Ig domain-containing protein [Pseudomonas vlassakiae]